MKITQLFIQLFGKLVTLELPERKDRQNRGIPWIAITAVLILISTACFIVTYGILYLIGLIGG